MACEAGQGAAKAQLGADLRRCPHSEDVAADVKLAAVEEQRPFDVLLNDEVALAHLSEASESLAATQQLDTSPLRAEAWLEHLGAVSAGSGGAVHVHVLGLSTCAW